jgi:acyl dehydratase
MTSRVEPQTPKDDSGLLKGRITDEAIELMRRRIGYTNPTLRRGYLQKPKNITASGDAIRQWAEGIGDANPLYNDPGYAARSRWADSVAPPGFETSMGLQRMPLMPADEERATRHALRGVQLFHSGSEHFYYRPIQPGTILHRSQWVAAVEEKEGNFTARSVLVTNGFAYWDAHEQVACDGSHWFMHAERRQAGGVKDAPADAAPFYTDEDLAAIEAAYDREFVRGAATLYLEDVQVGQKLPRMVKGPLTVTDLMNFQMGQGWGGYGNPPYRLAYENRKRLRGFYSRNEFNSWDTVQRIHWDPSLVQRVGVARLYDMGPMRFGMLTHFLTNYAGDDAWIYRIRYELRKFNFIGDTTWLDGTVLAARVDPLLGPLLELQIEGVNQRGQENLNATATVLVSSRSLGPAKLPPVPPLPVYRS